MNRLQNFIAYRNKLRTKLRSSETLHSNYLRQMYVKKILYVSYVQNISELGINLAIYTRCASRNAIYFSPILATVCLLFSTNWIFTCNSDRLDF